MTSIVLYVAERLPARLCVPVIVLLAGASYWASVPETAYSRTAAPWPLLGKALGEMTLLFVLFRLWDDLADAERDACVHPERVLVNADRRSFELVWLGLVGSAGMMLATRSAALVSFAVLLAALWTAYRFARPRVPDTFWRYGILLLKYPGLVGLVSVSLEPLRPARLTLAALAAYAGAAIYEAWHHDLRIDREVAHERSHS